MKIEKTGIKYINPFRRSHVFLAVSTWSGALGIRIFQLTMILSVHSIFVVYTKETKMGKISKALFSSLFISSATANVFEVTGCNDETLDVSSRCSSSTLNKLCLAFVLLKPRVKHQWSMDLEATFRPVLDQYRISVWQFIFILASTTCFVVQNSERLLWK